MACPPSCRLEWSREERLETDVLVAGGGLGGLAAALELRRYGYRVLLAHSGPLGGHHIYGRAPRLGDVDVQGLTSRASELEAVQGFFDGHHIYGQGIRYEVRYRHLVLATGGLDVPITFPGAHRAPMKTAEEVHREGPRGIHVVVWGSTEWGMRTAMDLAEDNEVVVMDNSAYLRDVKYFEAYRSRIKFEVVPAVRILGYRDGHLEVEVHLGKRGWERRRYRADLLVSAVRMANPYLAMRLGHKVFYSFELNSLVPRRNNYGELLTLDQRDKAVGGSAVYATGHLYGAVREGLEVEQGRLLATYIASKDGLESRDRAQEALERFLVTLTVEANWLYNLGNRLEKGTDGTGRYVEVNVFDVPHWASYWPQTEDIWEISICPCNGMSIEEAVGAIERLNGYKVEVKVTHDKVNLLRHLKVPNVLDLVGRGLCQESLCVPYASIILAAALSQKPSYFLYGKPSMLYGQEL